MVTGSFLPESVGGTEVYVAGLARALVEAGDEVVVAVDSPGKGGDVAGLDVRRARADGASALLAQSRPDVVHIHPLTGGDLLPWMRAAREAGIPVVCTYHTVTLTCARADLMLFGEEDCDGRIDQARCAVCVMQDRGMPVALARRIPDVSGTPAWVPRQVRSLLAIRGQRAEGLATWHAVREHVDAWIAPARWVAEVLAINGVPSGKIWLVRQGTTHSPTAPSHRERKGPLVVGYLGRLHRLKGLEVLLQAARAIPGAEIEIRIAGAGDAAEESALRRLHGGDPRIKWMGSLEPGDTSRFLGDLDLLVVPSLTRETGPLVALEAWAAGTPVIGSDAGGLAELFAEGAGIGFPRGDATALGELLLRMSRGEAGLPPLPPKVRTMSDVGMEMRRIYSGLERAHA
jgi:glycosyltransferase involved in cell wall biosynthesis